MAEELTLIQKLAKIRAMSDVVSKEKRGYNYTYSDITTILAKVTTGMNKYGVSLIPQIMPGTTKVEQVVSINTKVDKTGKSYDCTTTEMMVSAEMVYRWINNDNPDDFIDVPWYVTGSQSDPSQALGSGLTYTMRQFLTNYFQIAQTNTDVDAYRTKQKEAEDSENAAVSEEIVAQIDTMVKSYLADHSDEGEAMKKFFSKYVRGGNYLSIKNPTLAAKLMNDFKDTYLDKGEN